jgi:hypothetical protein
MNQGSARGWSAVWPAVASVVNAGGQSMTAEPAVLS